MSPRRLLVLFAALALVFTACGDDGGDDGTDAAGSQVESDDEGSDDEGSDDDGSGDEGAGDADGGSDGDGSIAGAFSGDCQRFVQAFDQDTSGFAAGDDPTESLQQAAEFFSEAAPQAPAAIEGDMEVLADAYGRAAELAEDVDFDAIQSGDAEAAANAAALGQAFSDPDFASAAQNVSAWITENCNAPAG